MHFHHRLYYINMNIDKTLHFVIGKPILTNIYVLQ